MPDLAAHIYIHAVADPGWKGGGERGLTESPFSHSFATSPPPSPLPPGPQGTGASSTQAQPPSHRILSLPQTCAHAHETVS